MGDWRGVDGRGVRGVEGSANAFLHFLLSQLEGGRLFQ